MEINKITNLYAKILIAMLCGCYLGATGQSALYISKFICTFIMFTGVMTICMSMHTIAVNKIYSASKIVSERYTTFVMCMGIVAFIIGMSGLVWLPLLHNIVQKFLIMLAGL